MKVMMTYNLGEIGAVPEKNWEKASPYSPAVPKQPDPKLINLSRVFWRNGSENPVSGGPGEVRVGFPTSQGENSMMAEIWWHFENFLAKLMKRSKSNGPTKQNPEDQCVAITRDGKVYVGRAFHDEVKHEDDDRKAD